MEFKAIGSIHSCYPEKFGIPRQSGLVDSPGYIELFKPYDDINALRGLDGFSHLWLIWLASANMNEAGEWDWQPTARPPRLGGNERKGIFATRSPFHPNLIGMSCVKLDRIEEGKIYILGADILDGTPLIDIKPYISYSDSIPDAKCGFAQGPEVGLLEVKWDESIDCSLISSEDQNLISQIIAQNPRPSYQNDAERVYGMCYKSYNISFTIDNGQATVIELTKA